VVKYIRARLPSQARRAGLVRVWEVRIPCQDSCSKGEVLQAVCAEVPTALFRHYSTIKQLCTGIFNSRRETGSVPDENRDNTQSLPSQKRLEGIPVGMETSPRKLLLLITALDGVEWSASRPGLFTPREIASGAHWIRGWIAPPKQSGRLWRRGKSCL
jgi:hypothetical protein